MVSHFLYLPHHQLVTLVQRSVLHLLNLADDEHSRFHKTDMIFIFVFEIFVFN